jgi:hypothetical protein
MHLHREPFDPSRTLVVRKPFTCLGVSYTPGQVFDADVTERRRRQMYDARWLDNSNAVGKRGLLASIGLGG